MEVRVYNRNLNIKKIGDKKYVVSDLWVLAMCNWSALLQDLMHADDNVEKY